jgi:hypothetical protein
VRGSQQCCTGALDCWHRRSGGRIQRRCSGCRCRCDANNSASQIRRQEEQQPRCFFFVFLLLIIILVLIVVTPSAR